jgi:hypothetical protein
MFLTLIANSLAVKLWTVNSSISFLATKGTKRIDVSTNHSCAFVLFRGYSLFVVQK